MRVSALWVLAGTSERSCPFMVTRTVAPWVTGFVLPGFAERVTLRVVGPLSLPVAVSVRWEDRVNPAIDWSSAAGLSASCRLAVPVSLLLRITSQ